MSPRALMGVGAEAGRVQAYSRPAPLRRASDGVTLIELMVAMTIGLLVAATALLLFSSARTGFTFVGNTVRMTEDGSFAIEAIARDVRMAGFAGCSGTEVRRDTTAGTETLTYTPALDAVASLPPDEAKLANPFLGAAAVLGESVFSLTNAVWGFDSVDNGLATLLEDGNGYVVVRTEPVLYVAGGSPRALQLSTAMASPSDVLTVESNPYRWDAKQFMIVSSCNGGEVFRAKAVTGAAGATTITPNVDLARAYGADAVVMPLTWSLYFVATRNGEKTSSLYRKGFDGLTKVVEEVVPGIEALRLHYGENISDVAATGLPAWVVDKNRTTAASVENWSRVLSVRMGVVMVGSDRGQQVTTDGTVELLGTTYTPPTAALGERRLRRVYSTSVQIRNRVRI